MPLRPTPAKPTSRYCPVCRDDLTNVPQPPCPRCGRDFDPSDPDTTSPHPAANCLSCNYDLAGQDAGPCPECGHTYDPLDPSTYRNQTTDRARQRNRVFTLLALACFLLGAWFLAQKTILPRPAYRYNGDPIWTLWLWFDEPYGVWHDNNNQRIRIWAGQPVRVDGAAYTTPPAFRSPLAGPVTQPATFVRDAYAVTREGDTWTLDVRVSGVPWQRLLLAFNSTRDDSEVVGVRIVGRGRDANDRPFTATGAGHEILQALIDHYDLTTEPGITLRDPDHVWVQGDDGQLARVTTDQARAMGHRPELITGDNIRRSTPRVY
ncbi:MAG: hypothetical protein Tsb0013_01770 [Phycisphaerales bacterium]